MRKHFASIKGSALSFQLLRLLLFSLGITLSAAEAAATGADTRPVFAAGIKAFQAGDLQQARRHLEAARAQGMTSRALTYNLGVVYYRLADYDNARRMFRQLEHTSNHTLAVYNLGLIALAQDDPARAGELFLMAADSEGKIAHLARAQLARLRGTHEPGHWHGLLAVAVGYEENIALFPDRAATALDGAFLESVGAVSGYAFRRDQQGLKFDARFYVREYFTEADFNVHLLRVESAWVHTLGQERVHLGLGGDQLWQGGDSREQRARLTAGLSTPACTSDPVSARCQLLVQAEQIVAAASRYRAYQGQHYRLETRYRAQWGDWSGDLRYRFGYDARKDWRTATEFFSVSPQAHTLSAKLGYQVTTALRISANASFRHSRYRDPHRLQTPEARLTLVRTDQRLALGLDAEYRFNRTFAMTAKVTHTDNDSNLARYRYHRQTTTLGISARL
ncbi:outer membrane beta-barrel protein [Marinobacter sp. X15-166B]|uniref:outer membrane beta-barrel protein n=1 Tax=Marinobacter sp. X15-166B TaxID=1897620 RepID=UPI00085BE4F7|nr:outer membrane beta-barrel protein [Marinobacter sp. X15-166B]OEY66372.1 hypothetical protein BG841_07805 [Marinobacter sp. X15-166B]